MNTIYFKQHLKNNNSNIKELNISLLFNLSRIYYNCLLKNKKNDDIERKLSNQMKRSIYKKLEIEKENIKRRGNSKRNNSLYKKEDEYFELAFFKKDFYIKDEFIFIYLKTKKLKVAISKNFKNIKDVYMVKLVKNKHGNFEIVYCYNFKTKYKETGIKAGVDIGLDTIFACYVNNNSKPLLVSGKKIKFINYKYTKSKKTKNDLKKRDYRLNYEINYVIKRLFDYLKYNNVDEIFVGDFTHLKKRFTAFNFYVFSYDVLRKKMERVANKEGIKINFVNESYTSKCSFLDFEDIKRKDLYLGERIKRGLFKTKNNHFIHADLNGAANILAKYIEVKERNNILLKPYYIKR